MKLFGSMPTPPYKHYEPREERNVVRDFGSWGHGAGIIIVLLALILIGWLAA